VASTESRDADAWARRKALLGAAGAPTRGERALRVTGAGVGSVGVASDASGASAGDEELSCSFDSGEGDGSTAVGSVEVRDSAVDPFELVSAPPELCTAPSRGSIAGSSFDGCESDCAFTEDGTVATCDDTEASPVLPDGETVDCWESDAGPVGEEDGSEVDEAEEPDASGSATATPGEFATAPVRVSVVAINPTRTMCCASTGMAAPPCS